MCGRPFSEIGMDKSIPYIGVIMTCDQPLIYPQRNLPEGYRFCFYEPGMESVWCDIQYAVEGVKTLDEAQMIFDREFGYDPDEMKRRMLFIYTEEGEPAGTATLWWGNMLGTEMQRIHWVAVSPEHQNKALSGALLSRLFLRYQELELQGGIYLTTQTWSYKAIGLYQKFGFQPYVKEKPKNWQKGTDFPAEQAQAWQIIEEKIRAYTNNE